MKKIDSHIFGICVKNMYPNVRPPLLKDVPDNRSLALIQAPENTVFVFVKNKNIRRALKQYINKIKPFISYFK